MGIMAAQNANSSYGRTVLMIDFLRMDCKLMISCFSETAFVVSNSDSVNVAPSSVLTGVSSASNREINKSESGGQSLPTF